jgi:hypothetical protein
VILVYRQQGGHKMKKSLISSLLIALLLFSPTLQANVFLEGKPAPERKMFWITEAGGIVRMVRNFGRLGVNYEFGLMYNLNKRSALGATLYFGLGVGNGFGIKTRYRRWLNSSFSVDISPGLLVGAAGKDPTFTGHVGINYKDWVALIAQVDSRHYWGSTSKIDLSLGIKLGSHAGMGLTAVSAVAGAALIVIAIIVLSGED